MWQFEDQLRQWGPSAPPRDISREQARAYCRWVTRTHYENFSVVSWLLPRELRQPFANVYAYCRWSDDLGDEAGSPERAQQLLEWWTGELNRCFSGISTHPVLLALQETIRTYDLPQQPFLDLLSAFRQDQIIQEYDTFDDLLDYCRRSANPVGELVLRLFRSWNTTTQPWSDAICTGLQLANFWQDVARDATLGRIYLPRADRERFGYDDEQFELRTSTPQFIALLEFEVQRAREYLVAGTPLLKAVPRGLRVDLALFQTGGLRILELISEQGYRVWEQRPQVSKSDRVRLFLRAWWHSWW